MDAAHEASQNLGVYPLDRRIRSFGTVAVEQGQVEAAEDDQDK